jgi:hypothetical protein
MKSKLPNPASKPSIKDILKKVAPLTLIANLAAALVAIGVDVPIIDVKQEGEDLVITRYGGRIERFPLDYNLVIKIDNLDSDKPEDEPLRTAEAVLGKDKNSDKEWFKSL